MLRERTPQGGLDVLSFGIATSELQSGRPDLRRRRRLKHGAARNAPPPLVLVEVAEFPLCTLQAVRHSLANVGVVDRPDLPAPGRASATRHRSGPAQPFRAQAQVEDHPSARGPQVAQTALNVLVEESAAARYLASESAQRSHFPPPCRTPRPRVDKSGGQEVPGYISAGRCGAPQQVSLLRR